MAGFPLKGTNRPPRTRRSGDASALCLMQRVQRDAAHLGLALLDVSAKQHLRLIGLALAVANIDEIIALINQQFDPEGQVVQYYNDGANNELFLDTARLRARGFTLKQVAAMLEALDFLDAAFTEDEVRTAQAALRK